ncbi:hypothetical protein H6P1_00496 (plasmid) [Variovorax sp. PBL-H6]|uniref:hypothetical protein n=2 Tax=Variovorax TaxID=34072 RepID=UPI0013170295|nr:hypothetical protein [Variovorax sp. PBL-H6]VTU43529.1 hypothetical protein H6P1_00496 [Variovorax sp. PBL-H6]
MATIPWHESLSKQAQADLYRLYEVLFEVRDLPASNKQRAFEAAAVGKHTWPIVGITMDALKHLCTKGTCDGLRRAHRVKRIDRAAAMFVRAERMTPDELFKHFFELDEVVLATVKENGRHGITHWAEVIDVPVEYFTRTGMKAVATDEDLAWANGALRSRGIAVVPEFTPKKRRRKGPAKKSH